MSRQTQVFLCAAAVVALLVVHNDWLFLGVYDPHTLLLGWIPADLVYHLAWVLAGALVVAAVAHVAWRRRS